MTFQVLSFGEDLGEAFRQGEALAPLTHPDYASLGDPLRKRKEG
ncbi:hypothetical protein [Mucilaginibacter gilvus]|nr:hypothetical protein [Mucilaginibacter gilvus]